MIIKDKKIIFVRHGKATTLDYSRTDHDRGLKKKGVTQSKLLGTKLNSLIPSFDVVYCSSSIRTKETFFFMNEELKISDAKIIFDKNLYLCEIDEIEERIVQMKESIKTVLFVIHNPCITDLGYRLDRRADRISNIKTGEAFIIEFKNELWSTFTMNNDYHLLFISQQ